MVATKGNLIVAKNTLKLCKTGYELLDKKRNILVHEMVLLMDTVKKLQREVAVIFNVAYTALQQANLDLGISTAEDLGYSIDIEDSLSVHFRSIMGVDIPIISMDDKSISLRYGLFNTTSSLDEACVRFNEVKKLLRSLAQIENSVYHLADSIKKTRKRANALTNILIPRYVDEVKEIQDILEEKEREEFSRLKVIKKNKDAD